MLLSWHGHRAVLLLALTQSLALASVNDEETRTKSLANTIVSNLQIPWIDGIDWLLQSSESSEVNDVRAWIQATESGEKWAVRILDNMLEHQRKIRRKTDQDIEIPDQCVKGRSHHKDATIRGDRYISLLENASAISGESSPSACDASSNNEVQAVQLDSHRPVGSEDFTTGEMATIFFLFAIGAFMIICTICDFVKRRRPGGASTTVNTLAKFSLYTNAMALLSTKVTSETMPAIHGIRCLSCCSIMIGHHFFLLSYLFRDVANILDILKYKTSWLAVYVCAALFAVDTFLIITGFLTTYLFFKSMKSGIKFNFLTMYLYRYFRLTPCLAVIMLLVATLFHRAGNNLSWESSISLVVDSCRENWWINFFYIQNITTRSGMCLLHTWYLAVDMQLFWMSPIILYPLYRWPKFGLGILSLFFITSVVASTVQLAVNGYSYGVLRLDMDLTSQIESAERYYISTINRASPYLIGMLLGYDIATKKRHLTQVNVAINWIIAGSLALFCVWASYQPAIHDFTYDVIVETTLGFLLRPAWSVAVAWMIYACTQGYGGIATRFLSLPFFIPLSRISYCIYLVHMLIQAAVIVAFQTYVNIWGPVIIIMLFGELVLSIIGAFALSLFIESPGIVLIKILSNRGKQSKDTTLVEDEHKIVKTFGN